MISVSDVLKAKNKEIQSIAPTATVFEALKKMSEKQIGALVVMENSKVVGIISERDYARKIILQGKTSKETLVKEVMSTTLFSVNPDTSVEEAMVLMTGKHVRHLPVFEKSKFVGIISIGDVVKSVISNKDFLINQLSEYIAGKYY
ncbi:MAG TPA: CBS domain-containing protein [Smithellaceae bacterium]|jgi:CBS domain-containing protein|nr:CBS domain-containing protein [Syntrophaceae bacterium]NMD05549.1 CBS domain-containing protein [Deltaproteobacteria bacterium]HNQ18606.1 CBS domain-containing protein [Smithellaceae bacterium]MBP8608635.1 CBS domain-containing protein [Syntrophaceae bacterium]HNT91208.1 CBS domain-containing protein [Smithellaceae bacterium]